MEKHKQLKLLTIASIRVPCAQNLYSLLQTFSFYFHFLFCENVEFYEKVEWRCVCVSIRSIFNIALRAKHTSSNTQSTFNVFHNIRDFFRSYTIYITFPSS